MIRVGRHAPPNLFACKTRRDDGSINSLDPKGSSVSSHLTDCCTASGITDGIHAHSNAGKDAQKRGAQAMSGTYLRFKQQVTALIRNIGNNYFGASDGLLKWGEYCEGQHSVK